MVEGHYLYLVQLHAMKEIAYVVLQGTKAMVSLEKSHCLFLRRKMRQRELTKFLVPKYGKRSSSGHFNLCMTKFQQVFAGCTKCSGGP